MNPHPRTEIAPLSNHPRRQRRPIIHRTHRPQDIRHRVIHMDHRRIAIARVKNRRSIRLRRHLCFSPIHSYLLPRISRNRRDLHPNTRHPGDRIPLLNLIRQNIAPRIRKPNIPPVRLSLAKIKIATLQPYQYGKIRLRHPSSQIRPLRRGQNKQRPRIRPATISLHAHRVYLGRPILRRHGVSHWTRKVSRTPRYRTNTGQRRQGEGRRQSNHRLRRHHRQRNTRPRNRPQP